MKCFLTYLFIFYCLLSLAQPNGGFEDWEMEFGNESPVAWQTSNFLCAFPFNTVSATKVSGIDKHSGNFALKVKSVHLVTNPLPDILDDTIGGAFTGRVNFTPFYIKPGYPYNSRPEMLTFWYKYFPVGNDKGNAGALLTRWNGIKRDTIAVSDTLLSYNPIYNLIQLNFNYFSNEVPDSAVILFSSSRHTNTARVNSALFIDDVEFSGWVTVNSYEQKNVVSSYPNPAKDELHFRANTQEKISIYIMDVRGKRLKTLVMNDKDVIFDTRNYCSGVYFYEVVGENKHVITRGKFTVVQ